MKIGFVIPWYGADISGGAEFECRVTAEQLKLNGYDVEVLTTCVKEFRSDWNVNFYKPGVDQVNGIPVRRFKIRKKNASEFHRINQKLMLGQFVGVEEEERFLREMVQSEDLVDYMQKNQNDYVYILIPYMFGTTYWGTLACPERSILLPCLHDESYAYMQPYRRMFQLARGVIYNAQSEKILAEKLYEIPASKGTLIGMGMNTSFASNGERFKSKYGIKNYLIYAGRKDEGKNIRLLVDYFCHYKRCFPGDLSLVIIGSGKFDISAEHLNKDVFDLGFVPVQDKLDAYGGALCLVNPSLNESFSIVMMESWLAGTPVLVHGGCEVTRDHCTSSQGGLYFENFEEFVGCIDFYRENPAKRARMAKNGAEYVRANYSWPTVIQKYKAAFEKWGFTA